MLSGVAALATAAVKNDSIRDTFYDACLSSNRQTATKAERVGGGCMSVWGREGYTAAAATAWTAWVVDCMTGGRQDRWVSSLIDP